MDIPFLVSYFFYDMYQQFYRFQPKGSLLLGGR